MERDPAFFFGETLEAVEGEGRVLVTPLEERLAIGAGCVDCRCMADGMVG